MFVSDIENPTMKKEETSERKVLFAISEILKKNHRMRAIPPKALNFTDEKVMNIDCPTMRTQYMYGIIRVNKLTRSKKAPL